jgi:hypothetical protein
MFWVVYPPLSDFDGEKNHENKLIRSSILQG